MDIKPFQVHYKAGLDRSIKPGLHGKFATELEAQAQARLCKKFFEERHGPKAAIVGIVVDDDALAKQKEQEESDLPPELESQVEMTELELLRSENARLRALSGDAECKGSSEEESDSTLKRGRRKPSRGTSSTTADSAEE